MLNGGAFLEMEKKSLSKLGRACDSHLECLKSDVFAVCLRRTCVDIPLGNQNKQFFSHNYINRGIKIYDSNFNDYDSLI